MWFDPGALVKNKTEPFAIPAIPAIPDEENSNTVSENRKVAKIAEPLEYENTVIEVKPAPKNCHDCLNFKCFNQHGGGAGTCLAGVQSNGSCWWSETLHQCEKFDAAVEWVYETNTITPGALIVTCYTPAGNPIKVEATSTEHADWLIEMNPKRVMP